MIHPDLELAICGILADCNYAMRSSFLAAVETKLVSAGWCGGVNQRQSKKNFNQCKKLAQPLVDLFSLEIVPSV